MNPKRSRCLMYFFILLIVCRIVPTTGDSPRHADAIWTFAASSYAINLNSDEYYVTVGSGVSFQSDCPPGVQVACRSLDFTGSSMSYMSLYNPSDLHVSDELSIIFYVDNSNSVDEILIDFGEVVACDSGEYNNAMIVPGLQVKSMENGGLLLESGNKRDCTLSSVLKENVASTSSSWVRHGISLQYDGNNVCQTALLEDSVWIYKGTIPCREGFFSSDTLPVKFGAYVGTANTDTRYTGKMACIQIYKSFDRSNLVDVCDSSSIDPSAAIQTYYRFGGSSPDIEDWDPSQTLETPTTDALTAITSTLEISTTDAPTTEQTSESSTSTECTEVTSWVTSSTTSSPTTVSSDDCSCRCTEVQPANYTQEEIQSIITSIQKDLEIDKDSVSSAVRKKTSAQDGRPSAHVVGSLGIAMCSFVTFLIIGADLITLFQYLGYAT